jgi:hypothetical protein
MAPATRPFVRRAGRSRLPDGATLVWSVAEGSRGRRWRAVTTVDGRITHALLFEATAGGRPIRLELTTERGMLTLHPDADERSAHGNVVHVAGVRPLVLPWSPDHAIEIVGRPIASAVMLARMARSVAVGEGETVSVLAVDPILAVRPGTRLVRRLAERRWEVADLGAGRSFELELDADGVPRFGAGDDDWPLET